MFDKLEDIICRYEEVMNELNEPDVIADKDRFRKLMKEHKLLQPVIETYRAYRKCTEDLAGAREMLTENPEPELRELCEAEIRQSKELLATLEEELNDGV